MTTALLATNDLLSAEKVAEKGRSTNWSALLLCTEMSCYTKDNKEGETGRSSLPSGSFSQMSDYLSFLNQFLNDDFGPIT